MSRPSVKYYMPIVYTVTQPCVFKLSYKDKYVIVKAKDHAQSVKAISKTLHQFLNGFESASRPDNLYHHLFKYVEKNPDEVFSIEIMLESDNSYELLKMEQTLLDQDKKNKKCLNNSTEAYIPLYNEITQMYGWIPRQAVLNFKKWLKSK